MKNKPQISAPHGRAIVRTVIAMAFLMAMSPSAHAQVPAMKPRVIQTTFSTEDIVIAAAVATEAPFNAKGDGKTDCTAAIQAAIDAVAKVGGGVVFLPEGRYLCKGNLLLRETVTLRGDWRSPEKDPKVVGTILMPTAGRGKPDAPPFVTLQRGSGIRNLSIWYPEQRPEEITPYPWTVAGTKEASGGIQRLTIVNSYQGLQHCAEFNWLHVIREVYGTPLKCGLAINQCVDVGKLVKIRFAPEYWLGSELMERTDKSETALREFMRREGTGIKLQRTDGENAYDLRINGYATGLHILSGAWAIFYGVEAIGGGVGLHIENKGQFIPQFTNCRFDGTDAGVIDRVGSPFNTCTLGGAARVAVRFDGPETLSLQNCTIAGGAEAGLTAQQGSLNVMGCDFKKAGSHIRVGSGVKRALIVGNSFVGKPSLDILSKGDVQISHHNFHLPSPKLPPALPPDPRPATSKLFNVTDFGARADAVRDSKLPFADNTGAFQAALDAAGKAGGGTVYVPGGNYAFKGTLSVPTGVELRGCFDVAHHTISGGSTLMPAAGRGEESGTPFVRLAAKSGLRGLSFWYPEQSIKDVKPYPWTIQSTGPGCWLLDVSSGNAYQVADFGSFPSEGHLIRCLWGAPIRKGLWVSKGSGTVEYCHFNAHFWGWRHPSYPEPAGTPAGGALNDAVIPYIMAHEDAFIFGRCPNTLQVHNFVFGAHSGLTFVADGGGSGGTVIGFQVDWDVPDALTVEAAAPAGLEIINFSGTWDVDKHTQKFSIRAKDGLVRAFNTFVVGDFAIDAGCDVLLQQAQAVNVAVKAGRVDVQNLRVHLSAVGKDVARCRLVGNTKIDGDTVFRFAPGANITGFANSLDLPSGSDGMFETGFETGQPLPRENIPAPIESNVQGASCRVVADVGRNGGAGLVISGKDAAEKSSHIYFAVFEMPVSVSPLTVLRYWIKPENELGRSTGIDLLFSDDSNLRGSLARDMEDRTLHPGQPKGPVGQWTKIESPIGKWLSGRTIRQIFLAYDENATTGPFKAVVDDICIGVASKAPGSSVQAKPEGGSYPAPLKVDLTVAPKTGRVRYTLDGSMPVGTSPVYEKPLIFDKPGAYEVRFQALDGSSNSVTTVSSRLYDVR